MPVLGWSPPYDDAYITLTSAQALWTGAIPAYPETPVLHGVTSPAHLVLVAALLSVADTPLTALWLSQVIGVALYVSGLWALCRGLSLPRAQSALFLLIGTGAGMTPHHLFNGLETGLVLGAVAWTLALASRRHRLAPIAFGTLPFVRPELALLSFPLAVWWLADLPRRAWIGPALLMLIGAGPWAIFLFWETGSILTGTAQIKTAFLTDTCWPLPNKAMTLAIAGARWAAALGPVALFVIGLRRPGLPAACGIAFGLALIAYAIGLPSHLPRYHHQRYLWGWLPVVLVGGIVLATRYGRVRRYAIPIIALIVLLRVPSMWAVHRGWTDSFHAEQAELLFWLDANVPSSERLMVIDAGYLAFTTKYRLIDAVGLKSPLSAQQHSAVTGPSCGVKRGESLSAIALASGVRYFVPWGEWDRRMNLAGQLRQAGWTIEPMRARPANAVGDWWYPVYRVQPDDDASPSPDH